MIIRTGPLQSPSSSSVQTVEYAFTPTEGQTISIPDSAAIIVNVLLWNTEAINSLTIVLPLLMSGRRVFIFSSNQVATLTYTSEQQDAQVKNGVVSMNMNDLVVFSSISVNSKIWARVATS